MRSCTRKYRPSSPGATVNVIAPQKWGAPRGGAVHRLISCSGGSSFLEHRRRRSKSKLCGGSATCEHGHQRISCKRCCERCCRRDTAEVPCPVFIHGCNIQQSIILLVFNREQGNEQYAALVGRVARQSSAKALFDAIFELEPKAQLCFHGLVDRMFQHLPGFRVQLLGIGFRFASRGLACLERKGLGFRTWDLGCRV